MSLSQFALRECLRKQLRLIENIRRASGTAVATQKDSETLPIEAPVDKEPGIFGLHYIPPSYKDWQPMPKNFKEHPDRDLVNFPHYEKPFFPISKVRLALIPDSWFRFAYDKTGVTGGYLFLGGIATFLCSKEFFIFDHEFEHLPPFIFVLYLMQAFVRYPFLKYRAAIHDNCYDSYEKERLRFKDELDEYTKTTKEQSEQTEKLSELVPEIQRETIGLQLEARYRANVKQVYDETKRRLDYLMDSEYAKKRFGHKHMIQWIVDQVMRSITPELQRTMTTKCISDLKLLAKSS